MNDDAEWEIMPHKTIEKIKDELDDLKLKAASNDSVSNESLRKSLDNLNRSVNQLMSLFKEAAEEMKIEEESKDRMSEDIHNKLNPLLKRMETLESENKKIAQGILAVADLVKDQQKNIPKSKPKKKETIKRTYSEELVPKNRMPNTGIPGKEELNPQNPRRNINTYQENINGKPVKNSYSEDNDYSDKEPNLPPLERPMPNFSSPSTGGMSRVPPPPNPNSFNPKPPMGNMNTNRSMQGMQRQGIPQQNQGMPQPPRMPPPPGMSSPGSNLGQGGMNMPPPPGNKGDSDKKGFLGKIFNK